ncbi:hypothetical protein PENTCL1PPCAC_14249, partial [Pristionchus entomophagus]
HANFIAQSVLLLLCSFAYRLWMLKTSAEQKQRQRRLWKAAQVIIMLFTLLNTIAFFLAGAYKVDNFLPEYATLSALQLSGGITDHLLPRFSVVSLLSQYFIGFYAIFKIRGILFTSIEKLRYSTDRHCHQLIFRSLTAQAILPLGHMTASSLWVLDVAGIVHSPLLQRSILVVNTS